MGDRSELPDLTSLALLLSVIELGSVSAAAEAHGMAQPSASARLNRLERQLGVPLLVRSPRGTQPSRDGAIVAAWASQLLDAAREFGRGVAGLRSRDAKVRIASSQTNAEFVLPRALAWLPASATPELTVGNSTWVIAMLRDGRADVGFIETPTTPKGYRSTVVADDDVIVVARPDHRWARARRRPLPLAELSTAALLSREQGSGTREAFERELRSHGVRAAAPRMELGSNAALRAALLNGDTPGVISRLAVDGDLVAGSLRELHFDGLSVQRTLRAVWRQDRPLSEPAAELVRAMGRARGSISVTAMAAPPETGR